jgi:hypothetical protein
MKNITAFEIIGKVNFPEPKDININMMPFIIGDITSIPDEYRQYFPLLESCNVEDEEFGKVGYLSISESFVEKSKSQRRGGIHIERPPSMSWGGGSTSSWGGGGRDWGNAWGKGNKSKNNSSRRQGLYMASTIEKSCRVWNSLVEEPGFGGSCEHLKEEELGESQYLKSSEIIWMTDSTPHEALPLLESQYRQWFRFVTSPVSLWYAKHSTENRLGIKPNCEIIHTSKF